MTEQLPPGATMHQALRDATEEFRLAVAARRLAHRPPAAYTFDQAAAQLSVRVEAAPEPARNPEQDVIDAIDALVDEQMSAGQHASRPDPCPLCGGNWHGLRRGACPGVTDTEGNPEQDARRDSDVFAHGEETLSAETSRPPGRALAQPAGPPRRDIDFSIRVDADCSFRVTPMLSTWRPGSREHPSDMRFAVVGGRRHEDGFPLTDLDTVEVRSRVEPGSGGWLAVAISRNHVPAQTYAVCVPQSTVAEFPAGYVWHSTRSLPCLPGVEARFVHAGGGRSVLELRHPSLPGGVAVMGFAR